jgi:predicted AAA+ superfamily ATPase
MYKRYLEARLNMALDASPIVLLSGARQTGKTTLMKQVAALKKFNYITFDDMTLLAAAQRDPVGFIEHQPKPLIIDEVQRVAEVALPIKVDVDQRNVPGLYALTGSANPLVMPKLNDSLAGRMIILNLWPLSRGEILGKKETFLDHIFDADWTPGSTEKWTRTEMLDAFIIGGYPRMQTLSAVMRREWCNSHLMTILERDVQDIANITRIKALPGLMQILATRASNLLNVADVGRLALIPYATLSAYLSILESLFLIVRQPAWHINRSTRLVKMPKIYLADTGILSYLLGVDQEMLSKNTLLVGQVLENFIVQEIRKQTTWSLRQVRLYHFRTHGGAEVDMVLEDASGKIVGIEVKSSSTVTSDAFRGLQVLEQEAGNLFVRGIVFYTGSSSAAFGKNLFALPVSALWS